MAASVASPAFEVVAATDSVSGPSYVPFVAQTPLLCGGAAAAMLLRYWGERHVHGEDFAHLVRPLEGGIVTTELVKELRERGFQTRTVEGRPAAVFAALARDVPSIVLLEGRPTLHYVVLVRASPGYVWVHDPNFGPERRLTRSDFDDQWSASGRWAVIATPDPSSTRGDDAPAPAGGADGPARSSAGVDAAMAALRAGDHETARLEAHALLDGSAEEAAMGHRILATSSYLQGEELDALPHWNAVSEPIVELAEIRGSDDTRHHVLARRLGLEPGQLLTRPGLRTAHRRLEDVDAVRSARVTYRPLPDGTVEVQAFVAERDRWPGALDGATLAAGALLDGRASTEVGPLLASGDRWRVEGSWRNAQALAGASLSTATLSLPGIVSLGLEWRRERFLVDGSSTTEAPSVDERLRGFVGIREWISPTVSMRGGVALERWPSDTRRVAVRAGASWRKEGDGALVDADAERWMGATDPFTRVDLRARWRHRLGGSPLEVRLTGGASAVGSASPRLVWPGAGVGEIREPLLRGHPLEADGVVGGPALGRRLAHATGELRLQRRFGPLLYGASFFVDAARAWRRTSSTSGGATPDDAVAFVDPGLGLFLDTGDRELRVDLARGGGDWVLSAGVTRHR